jgi:predicted metal-dependent phosphoesterase TrpH
MHISWSLHGLFISSDYPFHMRCDLHVHSTGSGMCSTPGLTRLCKESYNDPADVYERCKRLGMSIVTVTDHDSIDAVEVLRKHKDFFLSEEATVRMPSGTEMHLGVYDMTERDHVEIQRRRSDFISLLMYLTERKLFFSVNHVFSGLTGHREPADFDWFASYVPAFEVRNGQMREESNISADRLARRLNKIGIAGSDSHTLSGVALTFTEVPAARTVQDFFTGLRAGRGLIHGEHGGYAKLTADIYQFAGSLLREKPWAAFILPFTVLVPAITAAHWLNEIRFCKQWSARFEAAENAPRMLWELGSTQETSNPLQPLKVQPGFDANCLEASFAN